MAFLTGWTYRKQITIAGQSGAGTNYQVKLLVGESSGATGEDFDVAGHAVAFPTGKNVSGDLRFTASDGTTLLPFWVESVSGTTPNRLATIWVKVSADLGTNKNIYCYYGGTTTNVSSGDDTFLFFDDFDGDSLDGAKWTASDTGSGSRSFTGSVMTQSATASGGDRKITPIYSISGRVAIEQLVKTNGARRSFEGSELNKDVNNFAPDTFFEASQPTDGWMSSALIAGSWQTNYLLEDRATAANVWRILQIDNRGATTVVSLFNSSRTAIGSKAWSLDVGTTPTIGGFGSRYVNASATAETDWYMIRKFQATEPSYSTAGSEEAGTATSNPFLSFNF